MFIPFEGQPSAVNIPSHYTENNGTYTLDLDGAVDASQAEEFRNLNTALQQQMEDLHSRLTAADPFLARKLLADKFAAQEASLLAAGRIDHIIANLPMN